MQKTIAVLALFLAAFSSGRTLNAASSDPEAIIIAGVELRLGEDPRVVQEEFAKTGSVHLREMSSTSTGVGEETLVSIERRNAAGNTSSPEVYGSFIHDGRRILGIQRDWAMLSGEDRAKAPEVFYNLLSNLRESGCQRPVLDTHESRAPEGVSKSIRINCEKREAAMHIFEHRVQISESVFAPGR